eukprot:399637-Amorphochlora_amoeboformis.AAC.1
MNFLRQGLPMLAFMGVGSFGLSKLMMGKYVTEEKRLTEEAAKQNFDLDKELEVISQRGGR